MASSLRLRPLEPDDEAFSYRVYTSTRAEEMAQVPWSAAQQEAFLRMQYDAQRQHYLREYPGATWQVIECDGEPAGRLIVDRSEAELLLMDIALLPGWRGRGIGTTLVTALQAEAGAAGKPMHLHVEFFNPAWRLYERLGFGVLECSGIYCELEWRAPSEQPATVR